MSEQPQQQPEQTQEETAWNQRPIGKQYYRKNVGARIPEMTPEEIANARP